MECHARRTKPRPTVAVDRRAIQKGSRTELSSFFTIEENDEGRPDLSALEGIGRQYDDVAHEARGIEHGPLERRSLCHGGGHGASQGRRKAHEAAKKTALLHMLTCGTRCDGTTESSRASIRQPAHVH